MLIDDFVRSAIKQDKRNVFEKTKLLSTCPEVLKEFYQQANPVDVEVTMDGNAVRFVPADELETIQSDYSMEIQYMYTIKRYIPVVMGHAK